MFPHVSIDTKIPQRQDYYEWDISIGQGVSHSAPTLRVKRANGDLIKFHLCTDLNQELYGHGIAGTVCTGNMIRFHLCTEDIQLLIGMYSLSFYYQLPLSYKHIGSLKHYIPVSSQQRLARYLSSNPAVINRRTGALLGQSILSQFACVQYKVQLCV